MALGAPKGFEIGIYPAGRRDLLHPRCILKPPPPLTAGVPPTGDDSYGSWVSDPLPRLATCLKQLKVSSQQAAC